MRGDDFGLRLDGVYPHRAGGGVGHSGFRRCHQAASKPQTFPKYMPQTHKVMAFRDMTNWCIENPGKVAIYDRKQARQTDDVGVMVRGFLRTLGSNRIHDLLDPFWQNTRERVANEVCRDRKDLRRKRSRVPPQPVDHVTSSRQQATQRDPNVPTPSDQSSCHRSLLGNDGTLQRG